MASSYVGVQGKVNASSTAIAVAYPTGLADGDCLVAVCGSAARISTVTPASGWTVLDIQTQPSAAQGGFIAIRNNVAASESGGSVNFLANLAAKSVVICSAWRGIAAGATPTVIMAGEQALGGGSADFSDFTPSAQPYRLLRLAAASTPMTFTSSGGTYVIPTGGQLSTTGGSGASNATAAFEYDTTEENSLAGTGAVSMAMSASVGWSAWTLGLDAGTGGAATFPRTATDSVSISDTAVRAAINRIRAVPDTVTVSDAVVRGSARSRSATDSVVVSDAAIGQRGVSRSAADTVVMSDVADRAAGSRTRTAADAITISDTVAGATATADPPVQTVTITNSGQSVLNWIATKTQPWLEISPTSGTAPSTLSVQPHVAGLAAGVYTDTITITDTNATNSPQTIPVTFTVHSVSAAPARTATDSWTVSDSAVRATTTRIRAVSDSIAFSDLVSARTTTARTASDTVTVADAVTRSILTLRTVSDTIALLDAANRVTGRVRTTSDAISVSDIATQTRGLIRPVADTVAISDVAVGQRGLTRTAVDTVSLSDQANRAAIARVRTASDSIIFSDSINRTAILPRAVADSWAISDVAIRAATARSATASDSVPLSDFASAVKTGGSLKAAFDSWSVSDLAVRAAATRIRSSSDSVTLSDVANRLLGRPRAAADSFAITDTVARIAAYPRPVSDSWSVSDQAVRAPATRIRTVVDSVTITDAVARTGARPRAVADSIAVSDVVTRKTTIVRAVSDSWLVSDVVARVARFTRTASDSWTVTGIAAARYTTARAIFDTIVISDQVNRGLLTFARATTDEIVITDIAVGFYHPIAGITVINNASAVYLGEQPVDAVYVGAIKVWP